MEITLSTYINDKLVGKRDLDDAIIIHRISMPWRDRIRFLFSSGKIRIHIDDRPMVRALQEEASRNSERLEQQQARA